MALPQSSWKIPWHLVLIFSLLSAGILGLGYLYYEYQVAFFQKAKEAELNTIADLKVKQIVDWRQERMHDALLMLDDPIFALKVKELFTGQAPSDQQAAILHRLESLKQDFYVGISLFDLQGTVRLSIPEVKPELLPLVKTFAQEAVRTGKIFFSDLYLVPQSGEVNMSLAVPFHYHPGAQTMIVGALLYQIDPHHFLYPILDSWPTPSKTAELVMVRREKENAIVYLHELRHLPGPPLTLRKSLSETQFPAVKAALGKEGIVQGRDYRGVPVLAANRIIPDSPWFLTAKIDMDEVNAPFRRWAYLIPILTVALMATAGLGIAFVWRNRDVEFYRRQYESESEKRSLSQRYEYLTRYANDIILVMDQDWKIVEANDRALASYGYERKEFFDLHLWDLFADSRPSVTESKRMEMEMRDGLRFEATNRRRDGTTFPAEISSSLMEIGENRYYQYIIRDITARKQREKALRESEEQLRFLSSQLLIVQENERRRISKELHDELGQALIILKFQISSLESALPKNKKTLRNDCESLLQNLNNIIENVRRLSWDLIPVALEQLGLATAIKNLLEEFGKHYEVQWVPAQIEEINNLFSPLSQINTYRIFQEALTNIAKHAQATKILISAKKLDNHADFTIEDNGIGFDPQAIRDRESRDRGIGLATMKERARIAGGCLKIWSRPGAGAKLTFSIPLEKGA